MEKNENGFSSRGIGESSNGRNSACPGTGERWTPQSDMGGAANGNSSSGSEPYGTQLAMVYSPKQSWQMLYSPEKALMRGTLFEELDKPLEECGNG